MKKIGIFIFSLTLLLLATSSADGQMMGPGMMGEDEEVHESIETVLPEILNKYGKSSLQELDCSALSDAELARIGDAVMETNHPGEAHEAMDEMMGGEGSEALGAMHINMGRNYLGCVDRQSIGRGYAQNLVNKGGWNYQPASYLWLINGFLFSVLLIVLIRYFWKKGS